MSNNFDILILEQHRAFSRNLQWDMKFMKVQYSSIRRVQSLKEAEHAIAEATPHVVIVSLQLSNNEAEVFFQKFPPSSRSFAVILFDYQLEQPGRPSITAFDQTHTAHLIAEQEASGYLCVGAFSNKDLVRSLENARRYVQNILVRRQDARIITSLEKYFAHPFVAKAMESASSSNVSRLASANGVISFRLNGEQQQVQFDRLLRITGDGKYCQIAYFTDNGEIQEAHTNKEDIIKQIPESVIRVHASHWVNIIYIHEIQAESLMLVNGEEIPYSRGKRKNLDNILDGLSPQLYALSLLTNSLEAAPHAVLVSILPDAVNHAGGGCKAPKSRKKALAA